MLFRALSILVIGLCLTACQDKKVVLDGKREVVLLHEDSLEPSASLQKQKVQLGTVDADLNWYQPSKVATHLTHASFSDKKVNLVWDASIGSNDTDSKRLLASPILVGETVYILNNDSELVALNAKSGQQTWTLPLQKKKDLDARFGGGVSFAKDHLFVTTPYAEVVCVNAKTQKVIWRRSLRSPSRSAPTVSRNNVYVLTLNNEVVCLSQKDGKQLWSHRGLVESAGLLGGTNVAVSAHNTVVVPYTSGEVYALHADTGEMYWTESLSSYNRMDSIASLNHIHARPVVDGNLVFVISHSGRTAALDMKTGAIKWDQMFGGIQTPAVSGRWLFMITEDQILTCVEKKSGRIRWIRHLPKFSDPQNAKGHLVWNGPVLAGRHLVVSGGNNKVLLISPETGKTLQNLDLPSESVVDPIVAGKTILVVQKNGRIAAYR